MHRYCQRCTLTVNTASVAGSCSMVTERLAILFKCPVSKHCAAKQSKLGRCLCKVAMAQIGVTIAWSVNGTMRQVLLCHKGYLITMILTWHVVTDSCVLHMIATSCTPLQPPAHAGLHSHNKWQKRALIIQKQAEGSTFLHIFAGCITQWRAQSGTGGFLCTQSHRVWSADESGCCGLWIVERHPWWQTKSSR